MKDDSIKTNEIGIQNVMPTYQTSETSRLIEPDYDIFREQKAFEK
jgi:hypothetical protein